MNATQEIEMHCKGLANARADLRRRHEAKQKEQRALDAKHNDGLRQSQQVCNDLRTTIEGLVNANRAEFTKPKTREFHTITVGFEKTRDSITMPDEKILIKRIEELLPAKQGETVLDRTVTIIKTAFKKLPREILQKLGCAVVSGADKPVVRANDDDIEALVTKTLGDATPEAK
ncbi:MAG TPA: host-nuclease inhibitor Gam family protein [Verrucomicrobiae bacterium]|jgi:hypothetical protein|nr:host-nuclease inhibitor Gam family protein [Verrucomicrobiae bacterium]